MNKISGFARGPLVALIVVWLYVLSMFFIPVVDSTREPFYPLDGELAQFSYWVSESGGKIGSVIIGLIALGVYVFRKDLSSSQRWKELIVIILIAGAFAGGGAALNEHVVKEALAVPRANIVWLSQGNGGSTLGMSAEAFYALGDKNARSFALEEVLNRDSISLGLSPEIKAHWVSETGYSFPSGHSFAAMFFTTFFLLLAAGQVAGRRVWVFYALLPWVVMVCYSRSILRVHTPMDIAVGSLQGLILGLVALGVYRLVMRRISA